MTRIAAKETGVAVQAFEPPLFTLTDQASLEGQKRFVSATRAQLTLLLVAGGATAITWTRDDLDFTALIAGVAFVIAGLFRLDQLTGTPARVWYEGRAAAESVKTLSWMYAVGGNPFPATLSKEEADRDFEGQTRDIAAGLKSLAHLPSGVELSDPTGPMRELRHKALAERRDAYAEGRLRDQQRWYAAKSEFNQRRSHMWSRIVLLFEVLGAIGAFLKGFGVIDVDVLGLAGAAAATGAAWLETKQHQNLASAYRVAAQELESILGLVDEQQDEESWASFVSDAEQAISREHTLWKARVSEN